MKKTFAEKSNILVFLGTATLMITAVFFLKSCNKNSKTDQVRLSKETDANKIVPNSAKVISAKPDIPDDPNKRYIYLTFDDGPNKGTENLIKIINKYQIPITSFIVGKHAYDSKTQAKNLTELKNHKLVELANHSYSHAENRYSEFYKNPEKVIHDFDRAKDNLKFQNKYARTPGRNIWRTTNINATDIKTSKTSADELQRAGYVLVGWDLEWKPDNQMKLKGSHKEISKKIDSIFFNDLEKTSRHLVFLTHDQYLQDDDSVRELDLFISDLQNSNRFEFRKISDYPKINDILK
ncbi:polysaccharide deacetylase family protein [Epilithonimonas xixisoli]|uniref:Peptidoglycan/xylan/chitin deacetylase (PgdA/CDA1 family) n=1 Tax=Epilithonimonas xixisoli TaxID=1476462 RepID=A0A4R8IEC3_9FLAO|nr:polysaccharide deacetylase family protein [Epilithonimonas xixisoli]TDX83165.1 peptidoglycan/xylan/chitin deacetylase (PgdA/CDA1 family) [Epilithonimonas xixisoli]